MLVSERLEELGIELPEVAAPVAAYVPAMMVGNTVRTSGQLPFINGGEHVPVPEIPTLASLGVIVVTLIITTAASLYKTRVKDVKDAEKADAKAQVEGSDSS